MYVVCFCAIVVFFSDFDVSVVRDLTAYGLLFDSFVHACFS